MAHQVKIASLQRAAGSLCHHIKMSLDAGQHAVILGNQAAAKQVIRTLLNTRFDDNALHEAHAVLTKRAFDWDAFLAEAATEKLMPMLYEMLAGRQLLPPMVEATLKEAYRYHAERNLFLIYELGLALDRLSQAGIAAIVLKGAALLETVYESIAVRPMLDVDILIRKELVPQALQILAEDGYRQDIEPHSGAAFAFENEILLLKAGIEPIQLEIHWHLFDSPYYQQHLDLDWFWQQARPLAIDRNKSLILGPEAQIVHLCGHLALHHSFEPSILWLVDLAEVVSCYGDDIDWELVMEQARASQLVLSLQRSINQMLAFLRPSIPSSIVRQIRSMPVDDLENRVFSMHHEPDRSVGHYVWSDFVLLPNWRQKTRFLCAKLFPSPTYLRVRYDIASAYQIPLYYIWHWWIGLRSSLELLTNWVMMRLKKALR